MKYTEELIEEVREKNDIVDIISSYVSLKKKGASYMGLCPFHNERSPSFSVSRDKQVYYCFGCGQGGNVFTFLMEYNRLSFTEAMQELADRAGVELPEEELDSAQKMQSDRKVILREMNKQAAIYFNCLLRSSRGKNARAYLKDRGITDETIRHFGLGYADVYRDDLYRYLKSKGYKDAQLKDSSLVTIDTVKGCYDHFFNRVMFPIMDVNQRVIGFGGRVMGDGQPKYLNSRETVLFEKGWNLYGLNYAKRSREKRLILCEGYMDVISLHQAGITNAVAPLGTAFTENQALLLKRYTEELILSFDSDQAGIKAALRALPIIRNCGLRGRVLSMKPYKDPDELIKAEGKEGYRKRIMEALPGRIFEITVLEKEYDQKDPDSRTRFIHEAAKNLAEIEDAVERSTYADAAAGRFMIERKNFGDLINQYGRNRKFTESNARYRREPETREQRKARDEAQKMQPQSLLLTWLSEHPEIYPAIRPYVTTEDFLTPLYRSVAIMLFDQLEREEKLNLARIIDQFQNLEDQKEVASVFNTHLKFEPSPEGRDRALTDVVRRIKSNSLEEKMRQTADIVKWQELLAQKNKLQKLNIRMTD